MIRIKVDRILYTTVEKRVFIELFNIPHIIELADYGLAIEQNEITFKKLKELAIKACIPYPLLFAPLSIVKSQIQAKNKLLHEKIASKEEIRLSTRGKVHIGDIELLIKDIGRKQQFLKERILSKSRDNTFIGCVSKKVSQNSSIEIVANDIRESLNLNLSYLQALEKDSARNYIIECLEKQGIFVSLSSYNYMPQNLDPSLELSGLCIKDRKFPFIFINTRDGDEKPKIIESSGRQIFTLLTMIACVAMNKFILSSKAKQTANDPTKLAYQIAAELIIPLKQIQGIKLDTLDKLKEFAYFFKVTPSMLLYRVEKSGNVTKEKAKIFRNELTKEISNSSPKTYRAPLPVTGYTKYNGQRFSKEIVKAYNSKKITLPDVTNILFRNGKFEKKLFELYIKKHRQ